MGEMILDYDITTLESVMGKSVNRHLDFIKML